MSVRSRKVVRDLLGNRARTVLVVAAIAIGLAGLSTTLRARAIFTANLTQELAAINPSSATILTDGADAAAVAAVAAREDVVAAEGRLVTFGRIAVGGELRPLRLAVRNDLTAASVDRLRPELGSWPPPDGTIALERSSIEFAGLEVGDVATIIDPTGATHDLLVAATTHDLTIVSGRLVEFVFGYTTTATWEALGLPGGFNEIALTVAGDRLDGDHIAAVAEAAAAAVVAQGFDVRGVRIPQPGQHVLDNVVSSLLLILGSLGVLSLLLSGFLVFNTIAAMLARQLPQIGVMKAIGASRRDVTTLYLATVGGYSLLALVIAVPAGAIMARALARQLGSLLNINISQFGAPAWVWIVELSVALVVPMVAAMGPILSGTRATVAEAIRGGETVAEFGTSRIDRALTRLQRLPTSVRYALRNTFRRRVRLALTVVALSLGGAILVTVLTLRSSLLSTVDSIAAYWQQDVTVDLQEPLPFADLAAIVEQSDGVDGVEGWLVAPASVVRPDGRAAGDETIVFGVAPESPFIDPTMLEGRWLEAGDDRAVVINVDVTANEPELSVGAEVMLRFDGVDVGWQVVGISTTQLVAPGEPRPSVAIAYAPLRTVDAALTAAGGVNRLVVSGASHDQGAQTALADAVEDDLQTAGVALQAVETRSRMRAQVERLTTPILYLLVAMAGLFAVVGGLGLLGTMSLNVLERTKEVGVVRAVGATGPTVLSIVLVEGLAIATLSFLLGSVLAVPFGWAMGHTVGVRFLKVPLDFHFAPLGVALWLGMAVAVAAVASWIPARNASRLSVREAIAHE